MSTDKKQTKPTKRKKNLLVDHPAWAERLSKEWDYEKNDEMGVKPDEIGAGSHKKVGWKCEHGHTWDAVIGSRTRGCNCPHCSGYLPDPGKTDLQTVMPSLAREWHPTKNDDLEPKDVTPGSQKKIWWICEREHSWQATVKSRAAGGCGCPYCSGLRPVKNETDLQTLIPSVAKEWHPTKNGELTPADVTKSSHKIVWWRCENDHTWQAVVFSRANGSGCPQCAASRGEKDSAAWARSRDFVVGEQWRDQGCQDKSPLPFDLMLYAKTGSALMEIALVEYDGIHHSDPETYFNKKRMVTGTGFDYIKRHDAIKNKFCEDTGRILVRVPYTITGVEDIGAYIEAELRKHGLGWWFDASSASSDDAA